MAYKTPIIMVALQIANRANGGIESFSQILANLTRYRPIILTNMDSERTREWQQRGYETHIVEERASRVSVRQAPLHHAWAYANYARVALDLARSHGTRLLYVNDPLALQFMYPLTVANKVKCMFAMRNMPDPGIRQSRRKIRILFGACERLLFLSNDMEGRWQSFVGGFDTPASVTYSIVDKQLFDLARRRDGEDPFVLVPARITSSKRQLEFIRNVAPAVASTGLKILFAGDATASDAAYEKACREAAAPLGHRIEFLGYRSDLPELYSRASAVVVAARLEGLARAMIEAMACGCPVVSFDVCSAEEVLSGGSGVVVPSGDWQAMKDAILQLCADEGRMAAMGENGRSTAMRLFNAAGVVARYEQAFDDAAQGTA